VLHGVAGYLHAKPCMCCLQRFQHDFYGCKWYV